ncbi:MAG: threonine/serine exporter family protein [Lachnospiraceae bacterium]|nr:threonine/serine exporter family protein [Lachnospiraceae bacterium]
MNNKKIVQGILDIGESMLRSGAEIYRVQDSIERMCESYGFLQCDAFVIQSNIQISVETKEHKILTQIREVEKTGIDYDKLKELNELSRYVCANRPDDIKLHEKYREVMEKPAQKEWVIFCAQVIGATSFAVFYGCNFKDTLAALTLAAFIVLFGKWISKREESLLIYNLLLAFCAEVFVILSFRLGISEHPDWVMIGLVMLLISALGLNSGIHDMVNANFISGFLEIMNALLGAFGIACGIALAMLLMRWKGATGFIMNPNVCIQVLSCTIGCTGYACWFGVRGRKNMLYSGIGAFITWTIYLLVYEFTENNFYASIVSASFVAAYTYYMSRITKSPSTLFLTASVLPLMPGARLYYMMSGIVAKRYPVVLEHLTVIAEICVGIAFGYWIVDIVVRNVKNIKKQSR